MSDSLKEPVLVCESDHTSCSLMYVYCLNNATERHFIALFLNSVLYSKPLKGLWALICVLRSRLILWSLTTHP